MLKNKLIWLIRKAQEEKDPRKRDMLWEQVEEAGLPPDGTIIEDVEQDEGKE